MSDLFLEQIELGPMKNYVYILGSKESRECMVVDPAWEIVTINNFCEKNDLKLTGALLTHYHPDHCGGHLWGHDIEGVSELVGQCNIPVYCNKHEAEGVKTITGLSDSDLKKVEGGDRIKIGASEITALHTPGHTPGSQCFLASDCLVAGDTLFLSGCGRVDLPGGDSEQLFESLSTKLAKLPGKTVVYPGHGYDPQSSLRLDEVMKMNPYLASATLSDWQRLMGG